MNTGVQFLLHALYHNIRLEDGSIVPVLKKPYPIDKTPCLTLDEQDTRLKRKYFTYTPYEYLNREYDTSIVLNVWCDTETDRQNILTEIEKVFNWLETDNYQLCTNYKDGTCTTLKGACPVPTGTDGRSKKHQCPQPEKNQYTNLFTYYNIHRNTLNINQGIDNDEYDKKTPLLRTIIQISLNYTTLYCNDGKISETLEYKEE